MNREYEMEEFKDIKLYSENLMDIGFRDCKFENCSFEECNLENISIIDCKFDNCVFTNLKGDEYTLIQNIDFMNSQIIGINWQDFLPNVVFMDPINKMENCCLKYNTFMDMGFKRFDFRGNDILNSLFSQCDLGEGLFEKCNLEGTEYFKSDLRKADFREAKGYDIDIMTCKLKNGKFSTPEVINLLNTLEIKIY